MAQGFKKSLGKAKPAGYAASNKKGPKPGARVIKPKKSGAVSSARIQSSLTKANLKKIEASLVSKTKAAGEGSLRLVRPDPSLLEAAESKKSKKAVAAAKKSEMKDMNES